MARKIALKSVHLENREPIAYRELCTLVLKTSPTGQGFTPDEMMRTLAVMRAFRDAHPNATFVVLEDEEWRTLCEHLKGFRFAFADEAILEFCNDIKEAPAGAVASLMTETAGGNGSKS